MANNYTTISKKGIEYLCSLINQLANVSEGIDDLNLRTDGTFSSVKIDTLLNTLKTNCNEYTDRLVANLSRLELKIATSESEITQPNTMYLYKPSGSTSYEQYVVIEGTKVLLGTTDINMGDYYTITQADGKFVLKTDFNSLKTTVDKKVDKTDIVDNLTSTDTDKPLSANQGKVLKDEVDLKANDSDVVKKSDIVTTISNTSTDDEVPSAKAVNDLLQTEGSGNLTIPLNEDLNNLTYNRTRVWMNTQTVEIATFTNMPSGKYTECAVIFIPYGNATADYGEQIFVGNNNRIFIRNKVVSTTWTGWRRVCTTSVADVPKTVITSENTNITLNESCVYEVIDGICYVSLWGFQSTVTGQHIICTSMPKTKMNSQGICTYGNSGVGGGCAFTYCDIKRNGKLYVEINVTDQPLYGSFSYPVAES